MANSRNSSATPSGSNPAGSKPPGSMDPICDDLGAEQQALDALVADISDAEWGLATPAADWSVSDQISHLAFFDEAGLLAAVDPDAFAKQAERLVESAGQPGQPDMSLERGRSSTSAELLEWWRGARDGMMPVFRGLDAKTRVPWYGVSMGARSFATARLMEVWAHGQDVVDALGIERQATDRLRHVAHIANGARPYAYIVNGLEMPSSSIRVEIEAPSGEIWTWGEEGSSERISGTALDFCLVAIQRRHLDDVNLEITGDDARQWAGIIQTFAGGAGSGREPLSS